MTRSLNTMFNEASATKTHAGAQRRLDKLTHCLGSNPVDYINAVIQRPDGCYVAVIILNHSNEWLSGYALQLNICVTN